MVKRSLLAGVAILLSWMAIDLGLHRALLAPLYEENPALWRPAEQMSIPLVYAVTFALIGCVVVLYRFLVRPKSLGRGLALGALLGLVFGISSGLGTYIHMPVPLALAVGWFFGGLVKGLVAGALVGALIKEPKEAS